MKSIIITCAVLVGVLGSVCSSFGQDPFNRDWGLGIIVGEPTGISIKKWTSGADAFSSCRFVKRATPNC